MDFELALITLAVWFFTAKKFSDWKWVLVVTRIFPGPLNSLWKAWMDCSFCGGFWIALVLRGVTGWQTLPGLSRLHIGLDWTLDALATAMLVTLVALPLEMVLSKVKKIREETEKALPKPMIPKPQAPQGPPPPSTPDHRRTSGRPSGSPSGRPPGRNFQRGRGPRRPNPKPQS